MAELINCTEITVLRNTGLRRFLFYFCKRLPYRETFRNILSYARMYDDPVFNKYGNISVLIQEEL
jgi:hypothetical protein